MFNASDLKNWHNTSYVEFAYAGWHQELIRDRITLDDVAWELLGALSERQWRAAFRPAAIGRPIHPRPANEDRETADRWRRQTVDCR